MNDVMPTLGAIFFFVVWAWILKDIIRQLKYARDHKGRDAEPTFEQLSREQPLFVLDYEGCALRRTGALLGVGALIMFSILFFVCAEGIAGDAEYEPFLWFSGEQFYSMTVWAYRIISIGIASLFGLWSMHMLDKKISFYTNAVVLENYLGWKRMLALDDNIRITRNGKAAVLLLFNTLSYKHFVICNRRLMSITLHQEQALNEFLNRIPEEKKTFPLNY